jgi:SAM-dependent MidA family methyltransferase
LNLEERLRERIRREGPISFYEWMKAALYDEREGYYCTGRVRQGRSGDYRTAPETSPLFAATFANYFAKLFDKLGSPEHFTIVEVGAGSGEFAQGVLTSLRAEHPQAFPSTSYVIEEISEASRAQASARLSEFANQVSVRSPGVSADNASDTITGVVFSNELFDAFPVNRVVMRGGSLRQLFVGLNDSQFAWVENEPEQSVADYCDRIDLTLAEGQVFEINLDAEGFVARVANLLERGYLITVDYGAARRDLLTDPGRYEGTLRAFRRHQFGDNVLAKPGQQDLTTTIDWTQIIESGKRVDLKTAGFEQLDKFLIEQGLTELLAAVAADATDSAEAVRLLTSARQLILPTGMAASFQVLVQQKESKVY